MATWTNQTRSGANLTWDEATFQWQAATDVTWNSPFFPFENIPRSATPTYADATKHSSTFSNETKD